MRRWLSLTTVLALLLCIYGDVREKRGFVEEVDHEPIEDCAVDSVCVVFTHKQCTIKGVATDSFVWTTKPSDCDTNYGDVWARLDIQPVNVTNWNMTATLFLSRSGTEVNKPSDYQFFFGNSNSDDDYTSHLSFIENNSIMFKYNITRNGVEIEKKSDHPVTENGEFSTQNTYILLPDILGSHEFVLKRFSFTIHTNGEKLIEMFGPKVKLGGDVKYGGGEKVGTLVIDDADFLDRLNLLSNCDLSEIKEVCYDTCDKIFSGSNSSSNSTDSTESSTDKSEPSRITSCPSNLWFHSPSDGGMTRQWKKIDNLKCDMGWWQGKTANGIQKIHSSMELQCSGPEPSKLTSLAKIVIGVSAGIGGLILIGGIVLIVFFLSKKRKGENFGGNTEKKFTIRDSDSRAQTPGTPGGKSTEREKN